MHIQNADIIVLTINKLMKNRQTFIVQSVYRIRKWEGAATLIIGIDRLPRPAYFRCFILAWAAGVRNTCKKFIQND